MILSPVKQHQSQCSLVLVVLFSRTFLCCYRTAFPSSYHFRAMQQFMGQWGPLWFIIHNLLFLGCPPVFPDDGKAYISDVWVNRGRNEILSLFSTSESKRIAGIWLITSNQSYASSNGVIIFTGGDYIYSEKSSTSLPLFCSDV